MLQRPRLVFPRRTRHSRRRGSKLRQVHLLFKSRQPFAKHRIRLDGIPHRADDGVNDNRIAVFGLIGQERGFTGDLPGAMFRARRTQ
jgi:hypothetical protein